MGVGNCLLYATESKSIEKMQHCIELSSKSALNKLIKLKLKVNITQIRTWIELSCLCVHISIYLYNIQELLRKLPPNEM